MVSSCPRKAGCPQRSSWAARSSWRRARPDLVSADLVDRRFHRESLDQSWVTDITEHPTREGKVYCAVVLDVMSARGWGSTDLRRMSTRGANVPPWCVLKAVSGQRV